MTIIQKHLAELGLCSRREGERLVLEKKVTINGKTALIGQIVDPNKDVVAILGHKEKPKITVAIHKPRGVVCSTNPSEGKTIGQLLPQFANLNIVGRLDKASEGLLLLTSDGLITRAVTSNEHLIEKEYIVSTREKLFGGLLKDMEKGMKIDGEMTLPCTTELRDDRQSFLITLREGKKHQIRRMCDAKKLTVTMLKRLRIGPVRLLKMRPGEFRQLTDDEVATIKSVLLTP